MTIDDLLDKGWEYMTGEGDDRESASCFEGNYVYTAYIDADGRIELMRIHRTSGRSQWMHRHEDALEHIESLNNIAF